MTVVPTWWFVAVVLASLFGMVVAQPSLPNGKYSKYLEKSLPVDVPEHVLEARDNAVLKERRDADMAKSHGALPLHAGPFIFADHVAVDLDMETHGVSSVIEDGQGERVRVWRMKIVAPTAVSLSILCSRFYLPSGAEFYIQGETRRLGAFTGDLNNLPSGAFTTMALPGTSLLLEYYEPEGAEDKAQLKIKAVVYGYDSTSSYSEPEKGMSGRCFLDVACDEAKPFRPHHQSVVHMLLMDGQALCTGTMIATTSKRGEKLLLTANHCGVDHDLYNTELNIITFDFEAPECNAAEASSTELFPSKAVYGTEVIVANEPSDALLMRVRDIKNMFDSLDVYFACWTTEFKLTDDFHCVHHPSGDYKVVSVAEKPLEAVAWDEGHLGLAAHLHVQSWKVGATEGGSSGSPLFTVGGCIVGQLHGGMSTCERRIHDFYGSMVYSFPSMKAYLDPENTGATTAYGYYLKDALPLAQASDAESPKVVEPPKEEIIESAQDVADPVEKVMESPKKEIIESAQDVVDSVQEGVESVKEKVVEPAKDVVDSVEKVMESPKKEIIESAQDVVDSVQEGVESVKEKVVEPAKEAMGSAKEAVVESAKKVAESAKEIVVESPKEETIVTEKFEVVDNASESVEKVEIAATKAPETVVEEEAKPVVEEEAKPVVEEEANPAVEEKQEVSEPLSVEAESATTTGASNTDAVKPEEIQTEPISDSTDKADPSVKDTEARPNPTPKQVAQPKPEL